MSILAHQNSKGLSNMDKEAMVKRAEQEFVLAQALQTSEGRQQIAQTMFEPKIS